MVLDKKDRIISQTGNPISGSRLAESLQNYLPHLLYGFFLLQVHLLYHCLPGGRDGGAAGELGRPGLRPPDPGHVRGAAQPAECHLLLPPGDRGHHAALHPPLPAHVPPHVRPEEEGPRRRWGGGQEEGVVAAAGVWHNLGWNGIQGF